MDITGPEVPASLASPLAVARCATEAVSACLAAAAGLAEARTGRRPAVTLDTAHVAAAVRAEALLRDPGGHGIGGFAPLSRLWPAADGWVRTHANYPWHRAALLAALDTTPEQVGRAIAALPAVAVERLVYAAGGLAVAARRPGEWPDPEPDAPLIATRPLSTVPVAAPPVAAGLGTAPGGAPRSGAGVLPAAGIRVLDLTRVIAGPAGTRMLGALGADVLRVDPPGRPELPMHAVDGVVGKASTVLDAGTADGRETLHRLLGDADVLVTGYRPGALRRLGLDPDQVAERHPGTVVVTLSAWGTAGPWGARRGFDSLVQIVTGIGWLTRDPSDRPGALPCQLLDHATGYLAAAGALTALAERARTGVAAHVEVSLARTARWLLSTPAGDTAAPTETPVAPYLVPFGGGWTGVAPPGAFDGTPLSWPRLPPSYGTAPPAWR